MDYLDLSIWLMNLTRLESLYPLSLVEAPKNIKYKNFWVRKKFWKALFLVSSGSLKVPTNIRFRKNIRFKKILCQKNFVFQKFVVLKIFRVLKDLGPKKFLSKFFWVQTDSGSKKLKVKNNFGFKTLWVKKNSGSKIILGPK